MGFETALYTVFNCFSEKRNSLKFEQFNLLVLTLICLIHDAQCVQAVLLAEFSAHLGNKQMCSVCFRAVFEKLMQYLKH